MRTRARITSLFALVLALAPGSARTAPTDAQPTTVTYEGTLWLEGHYSRPGENHRYHSKQVFTTDRQGGVRLDWTTWQDGDSAIAPETFLLRPDAGVFHRDAPSAAWSALSGGRARAARLQAAAGLPELIGRMPIAGPGERGEPVTDRGRLTQWTRLKSHPRLGDVRDSVAYTWGDDPAPTALAMALYSRDSNWRLDARRTEWSNDAMPESLFVAPANATPAKPDDEDAVPGVAPAPVERAPGIWSFDLDDIGSRTVVAEFADHVALIECAVGSANGERLVDAIHAKWPGKPIRYASFSHHHPHYTGGLRALMADGATIVTTAGNEAMLRAFAARPFSLRPDRLARTPREPRITTYKGTYALEDSANHVVLYDYGSRSQHTDEFTVFWFPRQKLLFESELGWLTVDGAPRASRRAKALLAWVAERKLDVRTILQGWPERGTAATLTRAELGALVAGKK